MRHTGKWVSLLTLTLLMTWAGLILPPSVQAVAPDASQRAVLAAVERHARELDELSQQIWGFAEIALVETRSAALLANYLDRCGFQVERGVARMPTAFVATYGHGKPVIGFLAEYDTLPGLSQAAGEVEQKPVKAGAPGHGCGHNLLGVGAVGGAVALAETLRAEGKEGTVVLYGCPAEEIGLGKTVMARDGLFNRLDVALAWHPYSHTYVDESAFLANKGLRVEFFGRAAHGATAPWDGRGALDGLEVMEHAVALMREHVRPTARLNRIIEDGGQAVNVISEHASAHYMVRDTTLESVDEMAARLEKIAEGAALATETRARVTPLEGVRDSWYAPTLQETMRHCLKLVGAPPFDAADQALARSLQKVLGKPETGVRTTAEMTEPTGISNPSSDVAEVCAVVPLAHLRVACRPEGLANHHWNVTSCAGSPLGRKGMLTAAKVLALTGLELIRRPELVAKAKAEHREHTGGRPYRAPVPDAVLDAQLPKPRSANRREGSDVSPGPK